MEQGRILKLLSSVLHPVLAALVALAAAAVGVSMADARRSRMVILFSAGLLIGISLFGVLPEVLSGAGRVAGATMFASGFLLMALVNKYVYPVCPSCSHTHNHDACALALHGFAPPLLLAASLHSTMDGMSLAASHSHPTGHLGLALFLVIAMHKLPEGLALGSVFRASVRSRMTALGLVGAVQACTVLGALLTPVLGPYIGTAWTSLALGLAGGSFLYLGWHAVKGELRRPSPVPAFATALSGAAGAAIIQRGLEILIRR
jgi:zinc and cadmium transporter